jgi:hypothetical protein
MQTVVMVADSGEGFRARGAPGNFLNLNIGANVQRALPNSFWTRLYNKLGSPEYVRTNGKDAAIINAVEAIAYCLRQRTCTDLPF